MHQLMVMSLREMCYFSVPEHLRKSLPVFSFEDDEHEVLKLHLSPSNRIGADAYLFKVENLNQAIGGSEWDDVFDSWMDKAFGPAI